MPSDPHAPPPRSLPELFPWREPPPGGLARLRAARAADDARRARRFRVAWMAPAVACALLALVWLVARVAPDLTASPPAAARVAAHAAADAPMLVALGAAPAPRAAVTLRGHGAGDTATPVPLSDPGVVLFEVALSADAEPAPWPAPEVW